jgi:hypothetical protein
VREFFLECIAEAECDDWETSVVICRGLVFLSKDSLFRAFECIFAFLAVDIRDACVPSGCFQRFGEKAGIG